ncbi:MAG TPA: diacylglycerol kinase family protein [Actinomycetes bacterium]|nr:diacylglycerol kinase family protein [Actinomycetes bacterium]
MRAFVVWNPTAGGGRAASLIPGVLERLTRVGVEHSAHASTSLDDARGVVLGAAAEVDAVVAVGGDGTVGACAAALAEAGPAARAALGVVPAGSGNDLAAALGLPRHRPLVAASMLPTLPRRPVDLARVGAHRYLCVAGAGLDSQVNRLANRLRLPGGLRYVAALLVELARARPARFRLELDGRVLQQRAWFVAVANGPSYGGGMRIAPAARLDDGLLDVVVVGALPKLAFVRTFPRVFSGRHVGHPAVAVHRAAAVTVQADRPVPVYADGEPAGELPARIEVVPNALQVLATPAAPGLTAPPGS